MPHCLIEYSSDLEQENNIQRLVLLIHKIMAKAELFDVQSIKVRAVPIKIYLIGGNSLPFIHSTVRLLKGRTNHQKQILSQNILDTISKEFIPVDNITVDIIDINTHCYRKK